MRRRKRKKMVKISKKIKEKLEIKEQKKNLKKKEVSSSYVFSILYSSVMNDDDDYTRYIIIIY